MHPQYVAQMVSELAADDAIFTCDVGTPTVWAARLGNGRYCFPLTVTDHASRYLLLCEALESTRENLAITAFECSLIGEWKRAGFLKPCGSGASMPPSRAAASRSEQIRV